jgi:hypothetical protein
MSVLFSAGPDTGFEMGQSVVGCGAVLLAVLLAKLGAWMTLSSLPRSTGLKCVCASWCLTGFHVFVHVWQSQ